MSNQQWVDPYTFTGAAGAPGKGSGISTEPSSSEIRHALIAQTAYFRAQRRGFVPGEELEDWLAAEAEVDTALRLGSFTR